MPPPVPEPQPAPEPIPEPVPVPAPVPDPGPVTPPPVVILPPAPTPNPDQGPALPPPPPVVLPSPLPGTMIFGPFHLPLALLNDPRHSYTGTMRYGETCPVLRAQLDTVRQRGAHIFWGPTTKRAQFIAKRADGSPYFSVALWRQEFRARWTSCAGTIDSAFQDGTLSLAYAMDEPNCQTCWYADTSHGPLLITPPQVDSVAREVKLLIPAAGVAVRVHPGWFLAAGYVPRWLDASWAQYEGWHQPLPTERPDSFLARVVRDAKAAHLALIVGVNALDGGLGGKPISSRFTAAIWAALGGADVLGYTMASTRWRMTGTEYDRAMTVFAREPYICAILSWKWSPASNETSWTAERRLSVQAFDTLTAVRATSARTRDVLLTRLPGPCRRAP